MSFHVLKHWSNYNNNLEPHGSYICQHWNEILVKYDYRKNNIIVSITENIWNFICHNKIKMKTLCDEMIISLRQLQN